jgi:Clostripain family
MSKRKWVIMVYLAADDTLANFAIESLKQLKQTATNEVVVAAQFDPDGLSNEHQVRRYVFDKTTRNKPLLDDNKFWENSDHRSLNMADPGTLTGFINWVYRKYKAENYCLILWGHGPELLFELPARSDRQILPSGTGTYFTPVQLKQALQATDGTEKEKLRVIAIDACSMSMCEIAYELQGQAEFLVASQEEVPDPSFPYNTLVKRFCRGLDTKKLCQDGVGGM